MSDGLLTCLAQHQSANVEMNDPTNFQKETGDNQAYNNNKDSSEKMNAEKTAGQN